MMKQLNLGIDRLSNDNLLAHGYQFPSMDKQEEERFGKLMVQSAKDTGMFNTDDKWPGAFGKHVGNTRENEIQNFSGLVRILDAITLHGSITSKELADELGINKPAATNRLRYREKAGYIKHQGWQQVGMARSKLFILTQKGKDLLKEVGE